MKTNNKTVWRCVDWGSDKAQERFEGGKNRADPYILNMSMGTNGIYMNDEKLDLENDDRPCVFRGLGKSPHINKCIEKKYPLCISIQVILVMVRENSGIELLTIIYKH